MIDLERIYQNLCVKDPRNPIYVDLYAEDDPAPPPREDCYCNNCFYGRDELALEIIRLQDLLQKKEESEKTL